MPLFRAARWTTNESVQTEIKKNAVADVEKQLAYLDQALAGKDYILGKQFSVVDAYLFVVTGWCKWSKIPVGKYTNLNAYMKRVYARPAVQKVLTNEGLPDYLPE